MRTFVKAVQTDTVTIEVWDSGTIEIEINNYDATRGYLEKEETKELYKILKELFETKK